MMRLVIAIVLVLLRAVSYAGEPYRYIIDLVNTGDDRVRVALVPPGGLSGEADFCFPAIVPGTYEIYDFGRFITGFRVKGRNGVQPAYTKPDGNTYRFSQAEAIDSIFYEVNDTFDWSGMTDTSGKVVFEPGGTGFESGKYFAINTHGMFGYFRGKEMSPIEIVFRKPRGFYPATGLTDVRTGDTADVLRAPGYHELADSPILYALPDTTSLSVAGAQVMVACYAPNGRVTSGFIARALEQLLLAQRDYLGGQLPVSKYAFLFHFTDRPTLSGAHGALEHNRSSFYVLPEYDSTFLQQHIRDVAAHEFFHIVTPLTIHSEEIGNFDFNNPRMSRHLWLYEGWTEYAAHHAQVLGGLTGPGDFLNVMMEKYVNSIGNYNDTASFTWMSRNVLHEKVHPQYGNVYEKGAVISMCLDILLRDQSSGAYGMQDLMRDLAKRYGKDSSFKDETLFSEIGKLSNPEAEAFLRRHVEGHTPLPIKEILEKAGIAYEKERVTYEFSLGNPDLDFNADSGRLFVSGVDELDAFGKKLGYKKGDQLISFNGKALTMESVRDIISDYFGNVKKGDRVTIEIYRTVKGRQRKKTLSAKARQVKTVHKNQVSLVDEPTEKQKLVMRTWLGIF